MIISHKQVYKRTHIGYSFWMWLRFKTLLEMKGDLKCVIRLFSLSSSKKGGQLFWNRGSTYDYTTRTQCHVSFEFISSLTFFWSFSLFQPQIENGDKSEWCLYYIFCLLSLPYNCWYSFFFFFAVIMPPSALDRLG